MGRSAALWAAGMALTGALPGWGQPAAAPAGTGLLRRGDAAVRLDPCGVFGRETAAGDFMVGTTGTTRASGVWFSGVNQAGRGGRGVWLARPGSFRQASLPAFSFTAVTRDRLMSQWVLQGLRFQLVQQILTAPPDAEIPIPSYRLVQTYTITNQTGRPAGFDLIRYLDPSLGDAAADELAALTGDGHVRVFDAGPRGLPFIRTNLYSLGYAVRAGEFSGRLFALGRAVLDNRLAGESGDADADRDGRTDEPADIALAQGQSFMLLPGRSAVYVVYTRAGAAR